MTQLASDDFNRANGALGANWRNDVDFNNGGFVIASNAAVPNQTVNDCRSSYTGTAASADQYSEVTFGATAANGIGSGVGPQCRAAFTPGTFYRAIGNASGYEVGKSISTTFTSFSSGSGTTFAAGDRLRLEVQGTAWRVFKNDVQFASGTDSSIASGDWGVAYSSTDAGSTVDTWTGGDFTGAASTPGQPWQKQGGMGVQVAM